MKAIVISVGDELVSGQTVDINSAWLGRELGARGITVDAHWTVGDATDRIAEAIFTAADRVELVILSGGLGPTEDDVTREALARAMGVKLVLNEVCLGQIKEFFCRGGWAMTEANRRQAMIPEGAEPLENPGGTAPGIAAKLTRARVFALPGVPHEMQQMFAEQVTPRLLPGSDIILHRVIHTFGLGESAIATRIGDLMNRRANPTVGTAASAGMVSIRITSRAHDRNDAERAAERIVGELHRQLGALVVGEDDENMAAVVGKLLRRREATLALAESCTGGLVGKMITEVPGSSEYFLGGVVAYSDMLKQELLGVPFELLREHGAVSEPVAGAMAEGCRRRLGSDYAISVTGIAGPDGASESKPLGLVFIGLGHPGGIDVHRHVFSGMRAAVRMRSALTGLNYLRLVLLEAPVPEFDR